MTPHNLRERQRLLSDEEQEAHAAIARARWRELDHLARWRRWQFIILLAASIIALALTVALIAIGAFAGGTR